MFAPDETTRLKIEPAGLKLFKLQRNLDYKAVTNIKVVVKQSSVKKQVILLSQILKSCESLRILTIIVQTFNYA